MKKNQHKKQQPWPTKDAMQQVYDMKLWGGNTTVFYSGEGSHLPEMVTPYIQAMRSFLLSFKNRLSVCDLGCGDFNIGKELVQYTKQYIAIDIVPTLIKYNKEKFVAENLTFHCLDIAVDEIPFGECALVRQVLQHLSNDEVKSILKKLRNFKHVIITEHIPLGDFEANKDIISGQGIRLKKQSGLDVLAPPFNFKVKEEKQLVVVPMNEGKEALVTTYYRTF